MAPLLLYVIMAFKFDGTGFDIYHLQKHKENGKNHIESELS